MSGVVLVSPKFQFLDALGNPLAGGSVDVYLAGTTTRTTTWQDQAQSSTNTNPIVLDSNGSCTMVVDDSLLYKIVVSSSGGVVQPHLGGDNISGAGGGSGTVTLADYTALRAYSGASKGVTITGYSVSATPSGIAGTFIRDDTDTTSTDNGGTIIVASNGKRWKRSYVGAVDARWFGISTASSDNQTILQTALDYIGNIGGGELLIAGGTYKTKMLSPKRNTVINIRPDSALKAVTSGVNNFLFALGNTSLATTTLTTATAGTTQITVASTASFSANDLVNVSSGTFTGSGGEDGPCEYNTVKSIDDATHMTLDRPLQYTYTSFGFPGAAPRVLRFGPKSTVKRNIRITGGGQITPDTTFVSYMFNCSNALDIEIDHITFNSKGDVLASGGKIGNLNFHDNVCYGVATIVGGEFAMDIATMFESKIQRNSFLFEADSGGTAGNSMLFEVGCRDNIVSDNVIGPITGTSSGGVEFTFNSFGNKILNNYIFGRPADVTAGTVTLGVRTYANSTTYALRGDIVVGNRFQNIMQAMGIANVASVISHNTHENDTTHVNSTTFVTTTTGVSQIVGPNNSININRPVYLNNSTAGVLSILSGSTDPGSDWGAIGSIYFKKDGAAGKGAWFREAENGTPAWLPRNQLPKVTFANVGTPANGTMFYVTDGTAGSNPLTGGGTGCVAIRQNGAWKGL